VILANQHNVFRIRFVSQQDGVSLLLKIVLGLTALPQAGPS